MGAHHMEEFDDIVMDREPGAGDEDDGGDGGQAYQQDNAAGDQLDGADQQDQAAEPALVIVDRGSRHGGVECRRQALEAHARVSLQLYVDQGRQRQFFDELTGTKPRLEQRQHFFSAQRLGLGDARGGAQHLERPIDAGLGGGIGIGDAVLARHTRRRRDLHGQGIRQSPAPAAGGGAQHHQSGEREGRKVDDEDDQPRQEPVGGVVFEWQVGARPEHSDHPLRGLALDGEHTIAQVHLGVIEARDQGLVVGGDDDGGAELVQFLDQIKQAYADAVIDIARRLVGKQKMRPVDHGAGDGDALFLTAGQGRRTGLQMIGEAHPIQQLGDICRGYRSPWRRQPGAAGPRCP